MISPEGRLDQSGAKDLGHLLFILSSTLNGFYNDVCFVKAIPGAMKLFWRYTREINNVIRVILLQKGKTAVWHCLLLSTQLVRFAFARQ